MSSRNMQDIKTQIELLETKKITTCKMKNTLDRIDSSSDNIGEKKDWWTWRHSNRNYPK